MTAAAEAVERARIWDEPTPGEYVLKSPGDRAAEAPGAMHGASVAEVVRLAAQAERERIARAIEWQAQIDEDQFGINKTGLPPAEFAVLVMRKWADEIRRDDFEEPNR